MLIRTYTGEGTLESGSDDIRVRKVKVFGQVHLTEPREQPLLLDEVVDLVVERYMSVPSSGKGSVRQCGRRQRSVMRTMNHWAVNLTKPVHPDHVSRLVAFQMRKGNNAYR